MKRILVGVILLVFVLAGTSAVSGQEAVLELLRSDLRADKVTIVTVAMVLTDSQAQVFWPIYRDYEQDLRDIGDRRLALIKRYAEEYGAMGDSQAKELADDWFKIQDDRTRLLKKYYRRMERALSSSVAARFIQVEHHFSLVLDLQIASELPLIRAARR